MSHELSCSYTHIQGDQKVSMHLMITIQSLGAQRLFDHPVVHITLLITCDRWTNNLTICIIPNLLFHLNYLGSYGDETCGQMDKETAAWTQDCDLP